MRASVISGVVLMCALVQSLEHTVLYDPSSTFSHVPRTSIYLLVILSVLCLILLFGGIGGALAVGGIIANEILPTKYGVVDYLHLGNLWFNLADVCVLVGVAMVAARLLVPPSLSVE